MGTINICVYKRGNGKNHKILRFESTRAISFYAQQECTRKKNHWRVSAPNVH